MAPLAPRLLHPWHDILQRNGKILDGGDNDLKNEIRKPLYLTSSVVERALSSKTHFVETGFCLIRTIP